MIGGVMKNKKDAKASTIFLKKNRRAQVTIFIIIGIIIVAAGLLIYSFYPQIKSTIGTQQTTPQSFIQSCIETDIKNAVDKLSLQGGTISPENYVDYLGSKVAYACYTNEFYKLCVVQQPMLKQHIESEIKNAIDTNVGKCFNSMADSYRKKGYEVNLQEGDKKVELLPKRIVSTFNYSLTLTKGSTQKYDSFTVLLDNNLYDLIAIANSIIEWEATAGSADPSIYMTYYSDLKVEQKWAGEDGKSKVYILTERDTGNKFQFASRSQAWASGYVQPAI